MAEYEERIKSSLVNLSDDEIYFRLKNNYYTEEAKKIAEEELQRRGAHLKSESEIKEAEIVYETFISNEKIIGSAKEGQKSTKRPDTKKERQHEGRNGELRRKA